MPKAFFLESSSLPRENHWPPLPTLLRHSVAASGLSNDGSFTLVPRSSSSTITLPPGNAEVIRLDRHVYYLLGLLGRDGHPRGITFTGIIEHSLRPNVRILNNNSFVDRQLIYTFNAKVPSTSLSSHHC